jgi:GNAT superfamily N-acetyltransferase
MSDVAVRRAREDEGPAIAELWLASRRAAAIPPMVHSEAEVLAWISDVLLPSGEVWVVLEGPELVAMMALRDEWIEQLYVAPEHQRRGHGTRLLELAQAQRTLLKLWTFETNVAARNFYEVHDFRQQGQPSDENEEREPALRYGWQRAS